MCAPLRENIELVRTGQFARRVSDRFVFDNENAAGAPSVAVEHGDFRSNLALPDLRACLGDAWSEVHAQAQGEDTGDAWVFVRRGAPRVLLIQSRTEGYARVQWQVVVERAS